MDKVKTLSPEELNEMLKGTGWLLVGGPGIKQSPLVSSEYGGDGEGRILLPATVMDFKCNLLTLSFYVRH